jgi:putative hydrolase of the HAD superfamily
VKKTLLLFDLDDTLMIQEPIAARTVRDIAKTLSNEDIEPELFARRFWETTERLWSHQPFLSITKNLGISAGEGLWGDFNSQGPEMELMQKHIPTFRLQAWEQTLESFGIEEPSLAKSLCENFIDLRKARQELFPGTRMILEQLKEKYFLGMLTNGASDLQWFKIHNSGIEDLFDTITVSGDHGVGKPQKEIFAIAQEKFSGTATKVIMIGNSLSSDIQGAINAGIPCIWIDQKEEPPRPELQPTAVIERLSELEGVLQELGF